MYANCHEQIFSKQPNPAQRTRFLSQSTPGANRVFAFDPSDPSLQIGNTQFKHFFRSHLGMSPSPLLARFSRATCQCGFLLANDPHHFEFCVLTKNTIGYFRHKSKQEVLARCAELCGVPVEFERTLANGLRTDLTMHFPQIEQPVDGDVSITNPAAPAYRDTSASTEARSAAQNRCWEKVKKYRAAVEREGCRFLPLVWESYGAMAGSTLFLFQALREAAQFYGRTDAPSLKTMKDWAARQLVVCNALMIARGLQHMRLNAAK